MSDAALPNGVLCLGMAVQDTILSMPDMLEGPGKFYATGRYEMGGGPAATAAVTIARLGGNAVFAGRLGDDATADSILADLATRGVDTRPVRRFSDFVSPMSVVLVDPAGERLIAVHAPPMPEDATWLEPNLANIGAVLCDCTWPQGTARLLAQAAALGLPSILDVDVNRHDQATVGGLVRAATHVVFSRPGLSQFTECEDIAAGLASVASFLERPANLLGVTDGANGLYRWVSSDTPPDQTLPPRVEVCDTTGAGDAFHGALALVLANGWDTSAAIALAHVVAALKCTRQGGRAGLPDAAAIANFNPALAPMLALRPRSPDHVDAQRA